MTNTNTKQYNLMIIAGEVSGDHHGATLIEAVREYNKNIHFFGVGGQEMRKKGVDLIHSIDELAVLGVVEIIRHYPKIRKIFYDCVKYAVEKKIDAVILIDYPGFNIRLAKKLKENNIPVIYYISPQIWAWGTHRKKIIAQTVDKMIAFFEFEKKFYSDTALDIDFVGHPLVDSIKTSHDKKHFFEYNLIKPDNPVIGLLPGSRKNEISKLLPIMLNAADIIKKENKDIQFILPLGSSVPHKILLNIFNNSAFKDNIKLIEHQVYDTMAYSDMLMIASGTATLETACLCTPMVIIYKVNFITSLLARLVIKIPYIGLVNIVAGKKVVPEFLQHDATPKKIGKCVSEYIKNKKLLDRQREELKSIKQKLGRSGAVKRAGKIISDFINKL
ncbi:lipid-A-disaccharide synthase [bacterium]|nr:lipid-A-disaccharide synthase [bacterium]